MLVLLSLPNCSSTAHADASAAEREIARSAMQSGDELRNNGDQRGALLHYRSAHAIMHVPTTGLAVSQTELALGLLLEARSTAIEVVNLPGDGNESAIFAKARAAAAQLAARVRPLIPSIVVDVAPQAVHYTVAIDGVEVSEAARQLALKANPGQHTLEVKAPGYVTETRDFRLAEGESEPMRVHVVLLKAAQEAPAAQLVFTQPHLPVAPRRAAGTQRTNGESSKALEASKTRALVGFTAGGAIFLGGAAAGITSTLKTAEIDEHCDDGYCGEGRGNALSTANTLANIANVAIPVGVLGIGYALYELLSAPDAEPKKHSAAFEVRWTGPQTVGVTW